LISITSLLFAMIRVSVWRGFGFQELALPEQRQTLAELEVRSWPVRKRGRLQTGPWRERDGRAKFRCCVRGARVRGARVRVSFDEGLKHESPATAVAVMDVARESGVEADKLEGKTRKVQADAGIHHSAIKRTVTGFWGVGDGGIGIVMPARLPEADLERGAAPPNLWVLSGRSRDIAVVQGVSVMSAGKQRESVSQSKHV
ncbi:hypothetical protein P4O66_005065, partial [Electrophorus voltai]